MNIYTAPEIGTFPDPRILLHPNVPKALHGMNPRILLGQEFWDIIRRAAYREHGYKCHACGVPREKAPYHNWLEAHECYDINYETGEVRFKRAVALCHKCHMYIHDGFMSYMVQAGKMKYQKQKAILNHGDGLLAANELVKFWPPMVSLCGWEDWHMIIGDVRYERRFETFEDWENFYKNGGEPDP